MARLTAQNVETIPYGPLGIIAMPGCEAFADKVAPMYENWETTYGQDIVDAVEKYRAQ